jgi:hypothetical protein
MNDEWRVMEDNGVPVGQDYSELRRERIGIFQGNDYRGGGIGRLGVEGRGLVTGGLLSA